MFSRLLLSLSILFAVCLPIAAEDGFRSLFNGRDLDDWDGNPDLWTVEDGAITGRTKGPDHLEYNEFLIWRGGTLKNFELRAKVRVAGNNSGIQYRSRELPEVGKWSVGGYQCDVHPKAENNAMVYEERGRGIVAKNGQSVVTDPDGGKWLVAERDPVEVDTARWHEYTVVAKGNRITQKIDGKVTAELVDHDESARSLEGLLAFQIHKGPAMEVQIKDVRLKTLPDGGVTPFSEADVPSDAQQIEKPKPAGKGKGKGKAEAKAKPRPKRPAEVGPQVGENKATPVDRIKVPEGFEVELLYSVPGGDQGSWVALCHDDEGRVYASDQYGDLYRFTPPSAGEALKPADIEKVPVNIRAINGMVFAFGALYAGVNDYERVMQSGLYRITDSDGDDQLDRLELLRAFESKSDHGVHAVLPTPDGEGLFLVTGNNAVIDGGPVEGTSDSSPVPKNWGDDHLLPRMPDGRGHNRHVLAPGGIIYRLDPDGKDFEIFASGFRNIYDASLNKDGELFTYDADMEYDFNTPWYRPTRVNHVVGGTEAGWRNGAGKYPEFYSDNLPAAVNIGPGSPTGTLFGYGAKFPAKYQNAFYALDWSWGKVYAVHLEEDGASYTGTKEEFITGAPLPVTDAIVHPGDGAMYFAIGGRRVQSGLYRVSYTGGDSTAAVDLTPAVTPERELRHRLESFHGKADPKAVAAAWPHLDHEDRFIRWAARIALEHQPAAEWAGKALAEPVSGKRIPALLALARVRGVCPSHRPEAGPAVDTATRDRIFASLLELDWADLDDEERLGYVRLVQIVLNRFGDPDRTTVDALVATLDPAFPADSFEENWLLVETLSHLQAPNTAAKGMALIAEAGSQEPQMEYARSLRHLKAGWTPELRRQQLEWFLTAANYRGGASFEKFIEGIRADSLATFTEAETTEHAELIARKPERKSAIENVGAVFAGRAPTMWTLEELSDAAEDGLTGRDIDNGRKMFSAAACYACHRFGNAGGMNGPDLTGSGGRYSPHDFLDQIVNPSKEINEQFAPVVVTKSNGDIVSGVVVNLSGDNVTLNTDLTDPNQRVNVDRKEVESIEVSEVSPMPPMLLNMLTKEEVLDLVAYVLSGGDAENEMFAK
ncbi:MAG: family 16 glycoside hydrolase [Verrucomicrobiales bacterium]